jgi:hypothetical protein
MTIPYWVPEAANEFLDTERFIDDGWVQIDPKRYSKVVAIHYAPVAMVYYVVDRLVEGGEWKQLDGTHFSQELADNAARKRAYNDDVPHRVRMVVWDG